MFDYGKYLKRLQEGDLSINPFLAFMGVTLEALGDGSARFRMTVRRDFLQGAGVVQGGLVVAMSSETIAHAVMTQLATGESIATIELKNNFMASLKEGEAIAEATVFKKGHRVIIGDCLVSSDSGKILSRTTSSILLLSSDQA